MSPLFFSPLSEHFGRRPLFASGYTAYAVWTLCCAIAPSFTALIIFRLLAGLSAAVPNTIVAGLFADIYEDPVARGQAVAAFVFFGFGYILVFLAMILYLSDTYKCYAASAQAAANTTRSLAAVGLPFAASALYQHLGIRLTGGVLASASGIMAIIPFMFLVFRGKLKAESAFVE